MHKKELV
ncbi:hypothetical protein CP061683_1449A, partial [Chlamydia psittaci 06-1683]